MALLSTQWYEQLVQFFTNTNFPLKWRHVGDMVPQNHRRLDCLFNGLFALTLKETTKLQNTGPLWVESAGGDSIS